MKTIMKTLVVAVFVVLFGAIGTAKASIIPLSDTLLVTFDGVTQTRTIDELHGESVTDNIEFSFNDPGKNLKGNAFRATVWLVDPIGATFFGHDSAGTALYTGRRSDKIDIHLSHEHSTGKDTITITMNSDQEPGPHKVVTGYMEAGLNKPIDITAGIFSSDNLAILTRLGHTVDVKAASDVETTKVPEPGMLMLFGSGLLGLAFFGRKKFSK